MTRPDGDKSCVLTIGHSNHDIDPFISLLERNRVTLMVDVRSAPYSRFNPQFNREALQKALADQRIQYLYLGAELGARQTGGDRPANGSTKYKLIAKTPAFREGLAKVKEAARLQRPALLCAEKDPLDCHRAILVSRHLHDDELEVKHILEDGSLQSTEELEERLLRKFDLDQPDLFSSREERLDQAYEKQGNRMAVVENEPRRSTFPFD
jgi:uncharacterized protein (DUF488 family)